GRIRDRPARSIFPTTRKKTLVMPQEDIRGLKDLIHIPYPFYFYVMGAVLTAALVFLVFFFISKALRKKGRGSGAIPPLPLHEQILKELSDLGGSLDDAPDAVKKFHFRLSEIFRRYLEGRFAFAATDSTTEEILQKLPLLSALTEPQKEALTRIL